VAVSVSPKFKNPGERFDWSVDREQQQQQQQQQQFIVPTEEMQ